MKKKIKDSVYLKCPVCREYDVYITRTYFNDGFSLVDFECKCNNCGSILLLSAEIKLDEDGLQVVKRGESLIGDIIDYLDENKIYYSDNKNSLEIDINIVNNKSEAIIDLDTRSEWLDIRLEIETKKKNEVRDYLESVKIFSDVEVYEKSNLVSAEASAIIDKLDDFKALLDNIYKISNDIERIDNGE